MAVACAEIYAVVEVNLHKDGLWIDLPAEPWPHFVRLSPAATENEVALVVGTLSCYGRSQDNPAQSAKELAGTFPEVLPGGFAVVSSARAVYPSCCCGLETWAEWLKVLESGASPWMGHDPAPLVEVLNGHVYVWSDGAFGNKPPGEAPLVFTFHDFELAVQKAAADLAGFMSPLRSWLKVHAASSAHGIATLFENTFIKQSSEG